MSVNPVATSLIISMVLIGLALMVVAMPATAAEQLAPDDVLSAVVPR